MQYNLWNRRLERLSNFKIKQVLIYSNVEDIFRMLLFYFSKIYMYLSRMQQSYCYTQLCNYRKTFLFELYLLVNKFLWIAI